MHKKIIFISYAAIIAALYVVLTFFSSLLGLASGAIQVRISEALTILPAFTPAAIPGLFVGCLLANLLTGSLIWDVIFGSFATLIGAIGTYWIAKKGKRLSAIPPILANMLIVPMILQRVYGVSDAYWFLLLTIGIGEIVSAGILGFFLSTILERIPIFKKK